MTSEILITVFLEKILVKANEVEYNEAMRLEDFKQKAREIVEVRLEKAASLSDLDLYQMNLSLPPDYKYQSIREVQTIMVKGAFDALGFSVELGLFDKLEATEYWRQLHSKYRNLWPDTQ